jgi:pyruvate dehydrogenase E1 component alpha subunit
LRDRQPQRPLTAYAKAHEIPAASIDGNDVLAVRKVTQEFVERARQNEGPSLIVADTYRWREHCGPSYDNDLGYRTVSEFKDWENLCPVKKFREHLISLDFLSDDIEATLTSTIETEINQAFDSARNAPFPPPESAGLRVYA